MGDRRDRRESGDLRPATTGPPTWRDPKPPPRAGVGVVVHDPTGRIVSATDRAVELLGVSLNQLRAAVPRMPIWTFVDGDGQPVDPDDLPPFAVAREGGVRPGGLVGIDDGSPRGRRWLRIASDEVGDELGRVKLILTTVADVTAERRGEIVRRAASVLTARAAARAADVEGLTVEAVALLGPACEAARVFRVAIDRAEGRAILTHQWSANRREWPRGERGMPIDLLAGLMRHLSRGKAVCITDVRSLIGPSMMRERLDVWGIRSNVVAPIMVAGRLEGFVVVSWERPRECPSEVSDLVTLAGDLLATATVAHRLDGELTELRDRLLEAASGPPADLTLDARRAELFVDVMPDVLLEIDGDDVLVEITFPGNYRSEVLEALEGHNVLDVFQGSQQQRLAEVMRAVRAGSPVEIFEFSWQDEEVTRSYEARFTSGLGDRVVTVIREVTGVVERNRAAFEQSHVLAMANEELTRLVHERDQFLASVSHELRTPLNAILGLTEMLMDGTDESLTAGQTSTLRTIESSGRHLLELINDLLDLAKIEAGKMEMHDEPVDLPAMLADIQRMMRGQAERAGLQVWQPDPEHVALSVWDTGSGIAPGDQTRIFEPFAQLGGQSRRTGTGERRDGAGSGLGLSVVERLVSLHEGRIELDSAPGQGSRFTVFLPVAGPDADTGELPQIPEVAT